MKKKQAFAQQKEKATVYKGIKGIKKIYTLLVHTEALEYLSFGGGHMCEERMGTEWWNSIHTKRIACKLPSRQVFDETVKTFGKHLTQRPLSKARYLSKDLAQFQETVIVGDYVSICVFTENAYGFLIKDPLVAEGYKKYFELLWKQAKG